MKGIATLLFFGWVSLALAQQVDLDAEQKGFANLTRSGRLLNVVIQPQDAYFKIFVTGREAATVNMEEAEVEFSYGSADDRRQAQVKTITDPKTGQTYYLIDRKKEPYEDVQLKVRSGSTTEEFILPELQ